MTATTYTFSDIDPEGETGEPMVRVFDAKGAWVAYMICTEGWWVAYGSGDILDSGEDLPALKKSVAAILSEGDEPDPDPDDGETEFEPEPDDGPPEDDAPSEYDVERALELASFDPEAQADLAFHEALHPDGYGR